MQIPEIHGLLWSGCWCGARNSATLEELCWRPALLSATVLMAILVRDGSSFAFRILFFVWLMEWESPLAKAMKAAQVAYSAQVKRLGRGHGLGGPPPHVWRCLWRHLVETEKEANGEEEQGREQADEVEEKVEAEKKANAEEVTAEAVSGGGVQKRGRGRPKKEAKPKAEAEAKPKVERKGRKRKFNHETMCARCEGIAGFNHNYLSGCCELA